LNANSILASGDVLAGSQFVFWRDFSRFCAAFTGILPRHPDVSVFGEKEHRLYFLSSKTTIKKIDRSEIDGL
jgi:hypothetical protein